MEKKHSIAAAVAIVDANGVEEICPLSEGVNVTSRLVPFLILRFDHRRKDVIVELQDRVYVKEDAKWEYSSRLFRIAIANDWVTIRDQGGEPIAHLSSAKTAAQAPRACNARSGKKQKPQLFAAA